MNNIEFIQRLCNIINKSDLSNSIGTANIFEVMSLINSILEFLDHDCPKEDTKILKITIFTIAYIRNINNILKGKFKLDSTEKKILKTIRYDSIKIKKSELPS